MTGMMSLPFTRMTECCDGRFEIYRETNRTMKLRDYQEALIAETRSHFRSGKKRVVMQLPTGGGKTFTACSIIKGAVEKGRDVLVLVHRRVLVDQFSESLNVWGIEHGFIASGYPQTQHAVMVGMVQTVARRLDSMPIADLIVVDECHHATAGQYTKITEAMPSAAVVGLTATPRRTDGTGLGTVFDSMVFGPTMKDLIAQNALAPYVLYVPKSHIDMSNVKTARGEYVTKDLEEACNKSVVTGDAIENYHKYAKNGRFVAFTVSVNHAHEVARQFTAAGIPTSAIDSKMPADKVECALDQIRSGKIRGIASCNMISEGFDLPAVEAAIMLRPTKSLIVWLQSVGRALRFMPEKCAVIIDHTNNTFIHGVPDADREWTLETKPKKKQDSVFIRECQACRGSYEAHLDACPYCGAEPETDENGVRTGPIHKDGDLIEFTPEMLTMEKWRTGRFKDRLAECRSVADLDAMRKARGYKKGFVIYQAKQIFGMERHQTLRALGYSEAYIWRRTRF